MDLQLTGKKALVSGSTAGIGYAIARSLAQEGVDVIINGRQQHSVDQAIATIKQETGKDVHGFAGDLSQADQVQTLVKEYPEVDILVNNLGIFEPKAFEDTDDEDWEKHFNVNVQSGVRLARLYLPAMKINNWGRVLFISSESGIQIPPEMIHYGVSKAAQIAVARGLAESLAGTAITVNSILPGPTRSRGVADFVEALAAEQAISVEAFEQAFFEKVRPTSLIKRFATTDEVANLVTFIASPLASATTGAALRVDGGVVKSAY